MPPSIPILVRKETCATCAAAGTWPRVVRLVLTRGAACSAAWGSLRGCQRMRRSRGFFDPTVRRGLQYIVLFAQDPKVVALIVVKIVALIVAQFRVLEPETSRTNRRLNRRQNRRTNRRPNRRTNRRQSRRPRLSPAARVCRFVLAISCPQPAVGLSRARQVSAFVSGFVFSVVVRFAPRTAP